MNVGDIMWYVSNSEDELYHYGIKGMRWRHHKATFDADKLSDSDRQRYDQVNARIEVRNAANKSLQSQRSEQVNLHKDLANQYDKLYRKSTSLFTSKKNKEKYEQGKVTTKENMNIVSQRISDIDAKSVANKRNTAALLQEKSRIEVAQLNTPKEKSKIQKGLEWLSNLFKKKETPFKGGLKRPIPSGGKAR